MSERSEADAIRGRGEWVLGTFGSSASPVLQVKPLDHTAKKDST